MVDQKWVVKWRHNLKKKWNYLEEEAQGYLITVNLFCCAQTDRNIRGRFIEPPPLLPAFAPRRGGGMSELLRSRVENFTSQELSKVH